MALRALHFEKATLLRHYAECRQSLLFNSRSLCKRTAPTTLDPFIANRKPLLWHVVAILHIADEIGNTFPNVTLYNLAVRPVRLLHRPHREPSPVYCRSTYTVDGQDPVSFAKIDISRRKVGISLSCFSRPGTKTAFHALTRTQGYPPRQG